MNEGPLFPLGLRRVSDLAELARTARGKDDALAFAGDDRRSRKRGSDSFGNARVLADGRLRVLLHRKRFSGQRRLVHEQPVGFQQPDVGRNTHSLREQHDIPRDDLTSGDLLRFPVAQDAGCRLRQFPQPRHDAIGPVLVDELHGDVGDDDEDHHEGFHRLAEDERQRGNGEQDDHHRLFHAIDNQCPDASGADFFESVCPERRAMAPHLLIGESAVGIDLQGTQDGNPRIAPPVRRDGCLKVTVVAWLRGRHDQMNSCRRTSSLCGELSDGRSTCSPTRLVGVRNGFVKAVCW